VILYPDRPAAVTTLPRDRVTESALVPDSPVMPLSRLDAWLADRTEAQRFSVEQIGLDALRGWRTQRDTGNLVHESGRFFTVEGLRVRTDRGPDGGWEQPIIIQPEIGLLGILTREIDGVLHCLMQAKIEPGNVNSIQLSPTVQATRSNYTGVHRGRRVPYLEMFTAERRGRVIADALQSEQGSWFLHKRNRNMIVEAAGEVPDGGDFCWLTVGQLRELLHRDNLINMDTRTVLSCLPYTIDEEPEGDDFAAALRRSIAGRYPARHSMHEVLCWLSEVRSRRELVQTVVPLKRTARWHRTPEAIVHDDGRYFSVIGVEVQATGREVTGWTQPLISPPERGLVAFVVRRIDGVLHLLAHARVEAGSANVSELAPTVQCTPGNYRGLDAERQPRYLDLVRTARPEQVRFDTVQSEEGGRFYQAETRTMVVEVGEDFPLETPANYHWLTMHQMTALLRHANYVNIEARSLIACLHTLW
jgi:oxidase EvaA